MLLFRDEFRRHKKAEPAQVQIFMEAWAKYAIQLTNQLGKRGVHTAQPIGEEWNQFWVEKEKHSFFSGENMPASVLLESFTDEQIAQVE